LALEVDLLAEHGVDMNASTVHRWVQKLGPEVAKVLQNEIANPLPR
jgi:transposase-like protein